MTCARRAVPLLVAAHLGHLTAASPAVIGCHDLDANCCHISPSRDPDYAEYQRNTDHHVPGWEEIDLDAPAAERWVHVVRPKAQQLSTMINHFKSFLGFISRDLFKWMEDGKTFKHMASDVLDSLGEYGDEIRGIAAATGIPEEDLAVCNLMYEIEGGCSSIIAQDAAGNLVHGRNLDFGLFYGEDWRHLQWSLTEELRPLLTLVRFKRGGRVVYNSSVYLGYVGFHTGAKLGAFSITVNSRFDNERWQPLLRYLSGVDRSGRPLNLLLRDVMLQTENYTEALDVVRTSKILGPAYVILGGVRAGEGAVVSRSATEVVQERSLAKEAQAGRNFVVQTNWDAPQDPWYDNRRVPAEHCLQERYGDDISFKGMFEVLSAHPNRNRLTTFTALMSAQTGNFEAYLQFCEEFDCALWLNSTAQTVVV